MKEKIRSILQQNWSSLYKGIDIDKATEALYTFVINEKSNVLDSTVNYYKKELSEVIEVSIYQTGLLNLSLPELKLLLDIHSNNINKKAQLEELIKSIEEQIDNE